MRRNNNNAVRAFLIVMIAQFVSGRAGAQASNAEGFTNVKAVSNAENEDKTEQQEMRNELKALREEVDRLRAEVEQHKALPAGEHSAGEHNESIAAANAGATASRPPPLPVRLLH